MTSSWGREFSLRGQYLWFWRNIHIWKNKWEHPRLEEFHQSPWQLIEFGRCGAWCNWWISIFDMTSRLVRDLFWRSAEFETFFLVQVTPTVLFNAWFYGSAVMLIFSAEMLITFCFERNLISYFCCQLINTMHLTRSRKWSGLNITINARKAWQRGEGERSSHWELKCTTKTERSQRGSGGWSIRRN